MHVCMPWRSSSFTSDAEDTLWPWLAQDKSSFCVQGSVFAPCIFAMLTGYKWQHYSFAGPSWHSGNASKPKKGNFWSEGGTLQGRELFLWGRLLVFRKNRLTALRDTCKTMAACRVRRKRLLSKTILSQLWRRMIFLITSLCSVSCSICRSASFIKTCSVKKRFINKWFTGDISTYWSKSPQLTAISISKSN